jgi:hypothetical protein
LSRPPLSRLTCNSMLGSSRGAAPSICSQQKEKANHMRELLQVLPGGQVYGTRRSATADLRCPGFDKDVKTWTGNLRCRAPVCDARRAIARLRTPNGGAPSIFSRHKKKRFYRNCYNSCHVCPARLRASHGSVRNDYMVAIRDRRNSAHVNQYLEACGT